MTCEVHAFDARESGALGILLMYDAPTGAITPHWRTAFAKLTVLVEKGWP